MASKWGNVTKSVADGTKKANVADVASAAKKVDAPTIKPAVTPKKPAAPDGKAAVPGGKAAAQAPTAKGIMQTIQGKAGKVTKTQAAVGAGVVAGGVIALNDDKIAAEAEKRDPIKQAESSAAAVSDTVVTTVSAVGESVQNYVGEIGTSISDWLTWAAIWILALGSIGLIAYLGLHRFILGRNGTLIKMTVPPPLATGGALPAAPAPPPPDTSAIAPPPQPPAPPPPPSPPTNAMPPQLLAPRATAMPPMFRPVPPSQPPPPQTAQ